ncbi:MAG: protein translocase subunit SecD [Nocardioidaceae bacterium]
MASRTARNGRRLIGFFVVVALLYGAVALAGRWSPKLGLDLQGGTSITLTALTTNGKAPSQADLQQARTIIDQRVNGSGVAESAVSIQGNKNIVVDIPGKNRRDLVNTVKRTAQLRFRLVALLGSGAPAPAPSTSPSGSPSGSGTPQSSAGASPTATPKGRALSKGLLLADKGKAAKLAKQSPGASASANPSGNASGSPSGSPSATPTTTPSTGGLTKNGAAVSNQLAWMDNPGQKWIDKFTAYTCPKNPERAKPVADLPNQPLVTCGPNRTKYLLSSAMIEGTQLTSASAGIPQNQLQWQVNLGFNGSARKVFATVTNAIANVSSPLTGQQKQFAIVLDGRVIEAPTVISPIPNGQAEISGNFTAASAQSLATSLKYGALPLRFQVPVVSEEGPTLAADQLSAGLIAGGAGLALVMVYCLLYYRGLGLVVFTSLVVAGAMTFAIVLLMSTAIGFTLTLPGIAGLIVAVGITADSFIVYFERIRDEMRDGKSMRVAVEAGWLRARATCVAADTVSLLAAVVLYTFAIGVVKGFAFTLGVSTLIDLVVFFFFTKPMVSWLATFKFFNTGHKMSGLSPEHIGRIRPAAAGGVNR